MKTRIVEFLRGNRGVAAIEAAFILPFLVLLYMGGTELTAALDSRRAVTNASFSLAYSAASLEVVDARTRSLISAGHEGILNDTRLANARAVLRGYERLPDGSFIERWSWSVGGGGGVSSAAFQEAQRDNLNGREGIVVAVVEADHQPVFAGLFPSIGTFQGLHAQVPTRVSVPLYR